MKRISAIFVLFALQVAAQTVRPKDVRDAAKGGANSFPKLQEFLKNSDLEVRLEAVKAIAEIGGPRSIDPLLEATRDGDAEVQIRATDALVNFYLPGYWRSGLGMTLRRVGNTVRARFSDTNDQVIDAYVTV